VGDPIVEANEAPQRRLNPFVFPAETNVRFLLLILAVLMLAVNFGTLVNTALEVLVNPEIFVENIDAAPVEPEDLGPTDPLGSMLKSLESLAVPGLVVSLIFGVAWWIYRGHPGRISKKRALQPVPADKYQALMDEVEQLSARSQVSPEPEVLLKPGLRGLQAQAFGLRNRYQLGLDGGVRLLMRKSKDQFQALLLHELAHITNGDIGRTYFADALWRSVIYCLALPLIVTISLVAILGYLSALALGEFSINSLLNMILLLPVGVLVLLFILGLPLGAVAWIRAGLLRVREYYADWRAAMGGAEGALRTILASGVKREKAGRGRRIFRFHPSAQQRLNVLENPTALFQLTWDLPFFAGLLLAFVASGTSVLIYPLLGGVQSGIVILMGTLVERAQVNPVFFNIALARLATIFVPLSPLLIYLAICLGFGFLVARTVGLQIQRSSIIAVLETQKGCARYLRLLGAGALVAIGFEVGTMLAPPYLISPLGAIIYNIGDLGELLMIFPWIMGLAFFSWFGFIYVQYFSERLMVNCAGDTAPRRQINLLNLALSSGLGFIYLPMLALRVAITSSDPISDEMLIPLFSLGLPVGIMIYLLIFGITAVWIVVRRRKPKRCPACGQITAQGQALGRSCEACGNDLAPWSTVEPLLGGGGTG
jgi:Zn-dependent protease with chaperone function